MHDIIAGNRQVIVAAVASCLTLQIRLSPWCIDLGCTSISAIVSPMAMSSRRQSMLTRSIQYALFHDPKTFKKTLIGRILAFFCIFYIKLVKYQSDVFRKLRNETWKIDEREYEASFRTRADQKRPMQLIGGLGYSGSVRSLGLVYTPATFLLTM